VTKNFVITDVREVAGFAPKVNCTLTPITPENYHHVRDFRDESRVREYREKLANNELGFFAESAGEMVGSIWATLNRTNSPLIARKYMRLLPNEGLIHDVVTGAEVRGRGVGPFMIANIATELLKHHGVSKVIIDVNSRNRPSLRMMEKAGLQAKEKVIYVSAFGTLALEKKLAL
jgi:RimJ/RimL family protein N-acetyltransferase